MKRAMCSRSAMWLRKPTQLVFSPRYKVRASYFTAYSSSSPSSFSSAWIITSAGAAGFTLFMLGQEWDVAADEGHENEKSMFQTAKDWMFPEKFDEPEVLIPPPTPDQYGRIPRTLVMNFGQTICCPNWTRDQGWIITKRPGWDEFISTAFLNSYEMILWSSAAQHQDQQNIADLDQNQFCRQQLFRDHNTYRGIHMVKDLTLLGRDLKRLIMVDHDGSRVHPVENVLKVRAFYDDVHDKDLEKVASFLSDVKHFDIPDVRPFIKQFNENPGVDVFAEERAKQAAARAKLKNMNVVHKPVSSGVWTRLKQMFQGSASAKQADRYQN